MGGLLIRNLSSTGEELKGGIFIFLLDFFASFGSSGIYVEHSEDASADADPEGADTDGSFHMGVGRNHMESFSAKLSKSDKDSTDHMKYLTEQVKSILFTDLMRVATDPKFTAKLESIKHLHEKIRKSQGDMDAELDEEIVHCIVAWC